MWPPKRNEKKSSNYGFIIIWSWEEDYNKENKFEKTPVVFEIDELFNI